MGKYIRYSDNGVLIDINIDKVTYVFSYIHPRRSEAPYLVKVYMEGMSEKDNINAYFYDEKTRDEFLDALKGSQDETKEFHVPVTIGGLADRR